MSVNKTLNYELNQWELNDKPIMDEFNEDNRRVDEVLGDIDKELSNKVNLDVSLTWFKAEFANGYTSETNGIQYAIDNNKIAYITGNFLKGTAQFTPTELICSLPEGYRPSQNTSVFCAATGGMPWCSIIDIRTNGEVRWNGHVLPKYNIGSYLVINTSYKII